VTGKIVGANRLDARGAARALAIAQRQSIAGDAGAGLLAGRDIEIDAVEDFLDPTIRKIDARSISIDADGSRREAHSGMRQTRSENSLRSSVIMTSDGRDVGGAIWRGIYVICGLDPLISYSRPDFRRLRPQC